MDRSRREFLTVGTGLFVALSFPLSLRQRIRVVRRTLPLMGTIAELQVAHRDERLAEDAIDAALAELFRVERTMTRFRSDSDIGRANLGAAREGVRITTATALVVATALRWASASEGRFDPAVGGRGEGGRDSGAGTGHRPRHGVSRLRLVSVAHSGRQCGIRP